MSRKTSSLNQKNRRLNTKENPIILHIETSTNVCSVALSQGEQLLVLKESNEDKAHGRLLSVFIQEVFEEANLNITMLDAVSVSSGPGSYTGLRIGVSMCKGLCYGLNIPLISINTLEVLTHAARNESFVKAQIKETDLLCPLLDARRMEVYTCFFDTKTAIISEISAEIITEDSFRKNLESHRVFFFGNGMEKCKSLLNHENAIYVDNIVPSGQFMIRKSLEKYSNNLFEDVAYFEPLYLKDFVPTVSKKKIL